MITYFVAVNKGEDIVKENLKKSYEDFFEYEDKFFLLRTNDDVRRVSDTLGISTPVPLPESEESLAPVRGAVFEVNGAFHGRAEKSFWNWLTVGDQAHFA